MAAFDEKYTDEQRDAVAHAYEDRRIRPAKRVVELAKRGELTHGKVPLAAFEVNENTVRDLARNLRKRRAGELSTELAAQPPRDAIEALRRRLVSLADHEIAALEKQHNGKRDPKRIQDLGRCVRELAALPGPSDARPAPPTPREHGGPGPRGGTGMVGALMSAHRAAGPRNDERPADGGPNGGSRSAYGE